MDFLLWLFKCILRNCVPQPAQNTICEYVFPFKEHILFFFILTKAYRSDSVNDKQL